MIIGLGLDLVELARIRRSLDRFGTHFLHKILHADELAILSGQDNYLADTFVARVAARFAAKEAGVKALGTGFTQGICLHDLRVLSFPSGKPELVFHGKALSVATTLQVNSIHLSLTHAQTTAGAVVILEA